MLSVQLVEAIVDAVQSLRYLVETVDDATDSVAAAGVADKEMRQAVADVVRKFFKCRWRIIFD